jgi:hypothetical protein
VSDAAAANDRAGVRALNIDIHELLSLPCRVNMPGAGETAVRGR